MPLTPRSESQGSETPGSESGSAAAGTNPDQPTSPSPLSAPIAPPLAMPLAAKRGHSRLWDMIFAILTLEIGLFLLIYPWMDSWNLNHFPAQLRNYIHNYNPFGFSLEDLWDDPFFRGAVSGLGLVNLWICVREVVRLVRPSH